MKFDLKSIYSQTEARTRLALFGLGALVGAGMLGVAFFSPTLVLGLVVVLTVVAFTFARPMITLTALAWYLPFEPFVLKWMPDELYVYARYASEVGIYVLCAVVLWRWYTGDLKWKRTPIDKPFLAFCAVLVLSAIANVVPPLQAALGVRQIIRFILLFFVVVLLGPTKRWVRTTLAGVGIILAAQAGLGYLQSIVGAPMDTFLLPTARKFLGEIQLTPGAVQFWDPGQRVFGTMGRYDQLGTFIAFFLLIAIAFLYERALKADERQSVWWLVVLTLPVLALTYSRSSWFGFVLGFLFLAAWVKRDRRVRLAAVVVPLLLVVYVAYSGLAVNKLIDTADQSLAHRFFEAFSKERWVGEYYGYGRTYWVIQTIAQVVPASPMYGHGPARYGAGAVAAFGDTSVYDSFGLPFGVYGTEGYIDNNWFSLWGETGTLGLAAYLWMYVALFLACMRVYRTSNDKETRALALGVAAAMLAVALNAALATMLETRTLAVYLWMMAGVVVSLGQRERTLVE